MRADLAMAAGRVAELRGWPDAALTSIDDLEHETPGGPPLVVVAERLVQRADAQRIAGLRGAGREIALILGDGITAEAEPWLPPGTLVAGDSDADSEETADEAESPDLETFAPFMTNLSGTGPGFFLDADTPENRAREAFNQGVQLAEQGRRPEARAKYEEAVRYGGADGGSAAFNLGVIMGESGQVDEAIAWYEQARSMGDDYIRVQATVNAANQYSKRGDRQRARVLFDEAISSPFPDQIELAQWNLALLLAEIGDWGGAEVLMRVFVDHPGRRGAEACYNVGQCRWMLGDAQGARPWFQRAMTKGDPEISAAAAQSLSEL